MHVVQESKWRHNSSNTIDQMLVRGPTLSLRYATVGDAAALLELGSNADVTRFFSWGPYESIAVPLAYIDGLEGERDRGERLDFLIVHAQHGPIGVTGLSEFSRRDRRAVVGTWLGRRHWGTGANRESKALIAHLAFTTLGLERLGAYADLENPRSRAALERIGFVREGILRRFHRHGDQVHDVLVYSWLRDEWAGSPMSCTPVVVEGAPPPAIAHAEPNPVAAPS